MNSDFINIPICCDCRELIPKLDDFSLDMVIADPPYDLGFWDWVDDWIEPLKQKMKPTASIYIFCGIGTRSNSLCRILPIVQTYFTFKNLITWKKQRGYGTQRNWMYTREEIIFAVNGEDYVFTPQYTDELRPSFVSGWLRREAKRYPPRSEYKRASNIWVDIQEITVGVGNSKELLGHPAQKPSALMRRIIMASSNKGDLVFDPFAGTFTVSEMCNRLGRRWIACELDQNWVDVGNERLSRDLF